MGAGSLYLHPDFGGQYGQPFAVVPASQERVPMSFLYASQSDPGPYPFPRDVPIQASEDRHATVLQQGACALYETFNTYAEGGGFHADSGARFDLVTGAARPDGWTSATAAGLPILPGLARYDEAVEKGEILHALAFITGETEHAYVAPATHSSGTSNARWAPPMGLRVRLRADYDLARFHSASLSVLRALKRYGDVPDRQRGPAVLVARGRAGFALATAGSRAAQVGPGQRLRGGAAPAGQAGHLILLLWIVAPALC
jgi:hypothetical protein